MIREALPAETDALCDRIAAMDPWKRLGINSEAMAQAIYEDDIRRLLVWAEDGQVHGVVSFRTHHCAEGLFSRGFGEHLAGFHNVAWPCEWKQIPDAGYVNALAVFEGGQGRGIGSELLRAAESETFRGGIKTICLMVSDANKAAQSFYAMQGYRKILTFHDCLKKGNTEHLLQKNLRDDTDTW